MDDLILEKKLKETLNKKSEEIGGSQIGRASCRESV